MKLTIEVPEEVEAVLVAQSQAQGLAISEYVSELLLEQCENAKDLQVAECRLDSRQRPITGVQLRRNLGLDR